jgi:hypothetical protein
VLKTFDKLEMERKLNALLDMDEAEYSIITKKARDYYMKQTKSFTHEIISSYINKINNKKETCLTIR